MDFDNSRSGYIFFLILLFTLLSGCAASELSRGTAGSVDQAYIEMTSPPTELDLANGYQNANQTSKGLILGGIGGGIAGAAIGGMSGIPAGLICGAILFGSLGAYIDAHATLVDRITNRGVKVFVLGDQVKLVVNSSRVFIGHTPKIRSSFLSTLDLIAQLIGNYANISTRIAAYSNDTNPTIDCSLTQLQAESVERYLWKRCINTRLLYAAGYGGSHLVTCNSPGSYYNDNYRIEITFEKLPE